MLKDVFADILCERKEQDRKFPDDVRMDPHRWLAIFTEEVGEVAREVVERDTDKLYQELVQAVAVGVAWLEDLRRDK